MSPTTVVAVVGTAVSEAPAVRVADQNGSPVAGVQVTFAASQGAGALASSEALTDANGVARAGGWIVGQSAGRHQITARSAAVAGKSVVFSVMGIARSLKSIIRYAGDRQRAVAGTTTRFPLAVFASDTFGNPVAGVRISFTVVSGGGTIDRAPIATNADGVASSSLLQLGSAMGDQQVEAFTDGLRTTFTVSARQPCLILRCTDARLAFVRDGDIYAAAADGSNPVRLARGSEPAWSSDGRIAFSYADGVYVMNEDGSNVRLIAPGGSSPAWSPDAERLAVATERNGQQVIEVVTVDATIARPAVRLSFDRGWNAWPTFSPDGSRVAFVTDWTAFDFAYEVFVADREGKSREQLTNGFFGNQATWPNYLRYDQPAWSPDGTRMALMRCPAWQYTNCGDSALVVMNADGTGTVFLAATVGRVRPAWSSNGRWITFDGPGADRGSSSAIRFISPDGREQGVLIPNAHSATWRP
ncbi:MAG: Ig-like domain-containing protein [Gemmatimonadaceae bacterium]|nr:Ig-like domain-containing protein [Gemmatimonadaceae bacterium]